MVTDVEYLNQEFEKQLQIMPEAERAKTKKKTTKKKTSRKKAMAEEGDDA